MCESRDVFVGVLLAFAVGCVGSTRTCPAGSPDGSVWSNVFGCVRPCSAIGAGTLCVESDGAISGSDATPPHDAPEADVAPDVSCSSGTVACGARCVDPQTDLANCGRCGNACPARPGEAATCMLGMCGTNCTAGYERSGASCEMLAPRPLMPWSVALAASRRPNLRWLAPPGLTGANIQLCRDRDCTMEIARFDADGTTTRVPVDLPAGRVAYWRLRGRVGTETGTRTSATWQFRTGHFNDRPDYVWGVDLDVNGDGYSDLAVAAASEDRGATLQAGAVRVYHGSATGPGGFADATVYGERELAVLGGAVASAGDVNGDGFGDLIASEVGRYNGLTMSTVTARVVFGGHGGLQIATSRLLRGRDFAVQEPDVGEWVRGVGDLDGDGYADVAVGIGGASPSGLLDAGALLVFHGAADGPAAAPTRSILGTAERQRLGTTFAHASDFDGDGFADLGAGSGPGIALYRGTTTGVASAPTRIIVGNAFDSVGDTDGDGLADLATSDLKASAMGLLYAGSVAVYAGARSSNLVEASARTTLYGTRASQNLGIGVLGVSDTNQDGFADVCALSQQLPYLAWSRSLEIYAGSATGPLAVPATRHADRVARGAIWSANIDGGCDLDGDGRSDLVVGAPQSAPPAVLLYISNGSALPSEPSRTISAPPASIGFSESVGCR